MLALFTALPRFCGENAALCGTAFAASGACGYLEGSGVRCLAASWKIEKKSNEALPRLFFSFLLPGSWLDDRGVFP